MTDQEFEALVVSGIEALPEWVREKMHNVAIVIEDGLSPETRSELGLLPDEALYGLYEGVPQTERSHDYIALPDKITIFKHPVLEGLTTSEEIRERVANTVWHEVAHHFGFEEDELRFEEERRGKTL